MAATFRLRLAISLLLLLMVPACSPPSVEQATNNPQKSNVDKQKSPAAAPHTARQAPPPIADGSDWPGFLGPTGDGKSPENSLHLPWPAAGPPIVWQTEIAEGYAAPSISQGRLYLFDRHRDQNRLRCLESRTGHPAWQFQYDTQYEDRYGYSNGPRCCPVIDGDHVYVLGAEGMLHCLRTADGQVVWKCDTTAQFGVVQNFFGVGSTPVIDGDLLIAQIGGSAAEPNDPADDLNPTRGNGTAIVAFDKRTGEVKYRAGDELASYASPVLATIEGRRWGFLFARGGLIGFEPATGKIDFHYPWRASIIESVNASNPVVVGNEVFISETYGPGSSLLKVRPGGSSVGWRDDKKKRDKAMQTHWNTPIHVDGYLYGCSGRHTENSELRCIEWKTGKVMWSRPGMTRTTLTYLDGHFLCLGEYGTLWLFRATPNKCEIVAELPLGADGAEPAAAPAQRLLQWPAWAAPVVSHGLLYLRGKNRLVCMDLAGVDVAVPKK
ncbi:MAG: PQQ-like beta-propeller repeat protein [Planctomycetia bacterium]|nr:PQQ-like beta-propeller repeat protein [Planctomycetia bacterium]